MEIFAYLNDGMRSLQEQKKISKETESNQSFDFSFISFLMKIK